MQPPIEIVKATRRPAWPRTTLIIVGVFAAAALGLTMLSKALGVSLTTCLLKRMTGVPCPACGGSRTALYAIEGRLVESFVCNPLIFIILAVSMALLTLRLVTGRRLVLNLSRGQKIVALVVGGLVVAANWAYLLWAGR